MVVGGRRTSIAVFFTLGAGLIAFIVFLYVGWVLLGWRHRLLLFFRILLVLAATAQSRTPVASIRFYLEPLKPRSGEEPKRQQFYRPMPDDSARLLGTIEQILRTGRTGQTKRALNVSAIDFGDIVQDCLARARR